MNFSVIKLSLLFLAGIFTLGSYSNKDIENQSNTNVNIVLNNGCENGKQAWTPSGTSVLTIKTTATDVYQGKATCSWDAGAASETLRSEPVLIPNSIAGYYGAPSLWYKGGGNANITVRLKDADNNPVVGFTPVVITTAATEWTELQLYGVYPSLATSINNRTLYIELESAGNANPIDFDSVWVGVKEIGQGASGGWKSYTDSEVTVSLTSITGFTSATSNFRPYKDPYKGKWFLEFNIFIVRATGGTGTGLVNIAGVTFENTNQVSCGITDGGVGKDNLLSECKTVNASNTITLEASTAVYTGITLSGSVQLASKPTWADVDGSVKLFDNSMAKANYQLTIENNTGGFIPNAYTIFDGETVSGTNSSDYNAGTDVWTPSFTGRVSVSVNVGTGSGSGSLRFAVNRNSGTLTTSQAILEFTGDTRTVSTTFEFDVTQGDQIRFWNINAIASQNYLTLGDWNKIFITRKQEFNVASSLGFSPLASEDKAGLVTSVTPNIVDADASNKGLITTGTQIIAGQKTFNQPIVTNGISTASGANTVGAASTLVVYTAPNDGNNQLYLVSAMYRSGNPSRIIALVTSNVGTPLQVFDIASSTATVSVSGQDIRITNTGAGAVNWVWNVTKLY